jgi:uncharacterized membrane protein YbhN (UPF0104 family)
MQKKTLQWIGTIIGVCLFSLAIWVLVHELRTHNFKEVREHFSNLPTRRSYAALFFMVCNYLSLTLYDTLAFRYVKHGLPYPKIGMTSFIGYAFSHNIGLTFLTSGSVRYRFYSAWEVSALDVAKIVAFCGITFWLGFCTLGGLTFGFGSLALPDSFTFSPVALHWLGAALITLAAAYIGLSFGHQKSLKIRNWSFQMPHPLIAMGQIGASCLDWLTAAAILYALLPPLPNLGYFSFLGIYLLGQIAGMVSQVPGGLGVFETVILLLLEPYYSPSVVMGMLLAFRGIYYLIPMGLAISLLGGYELFRKRR